MEHILSYLNYFLSTHKEKAALWLLTQARVHSGISIELRKQAYRLLGLKTSWPTTQTPDPD